MSSCKWICSINAVCQQIYNLNGVDLPREHQCADIMLSIMHSGVKGLWSINHSFGHHLYSLSLRGKCSGLYSFQSSFISFERTSFLCLGLLWVALDGRGGGILSQGLWGKAAADSWVHHVPWCHKDTTNREKSCSHVLWELAPDPCQDSGFPGALKIFGPWGLYIAQGIRCQTLTLKKAHGKQIKMTS